MSTVASTKRPNFAQVMHIVKQTAKLAREFVQLDHQRVFSPRDVPEFSRDGLVAVSGNSDGAPDFKKVSGEAGGCSLLNREWVTHNTDTIDCPWPLWAQVKLRLLMVRHRYWGKELYLQHPPVGDFWKIFAEMRASCVDATGWTAADDGRFVARLMARIFQERVMMLDEGELVGTLGGGIRLCCDVVTFETLARSTPLWNIGPPSLTRSARLLVTEVEMDVLRKHGYEGPE